MATTCNDVNFPNNPNSPPFARYVDTLEETAVELAELLGIAKSRRPTIAVNLQFPRVHIFSMTTRKKYAKTETNG